MRKTAAGRIAAVAIAALLLVTVATATARDPALFPPGPGQSVEIFVVDNGFHSDIAAPRRAIMAAGGPLASAAARATGQPWVLIGWGDERFYEDQSPWQGRLIDGLRALIGGRTTVVHLEGISLPPDLAWRDGVRRINVSPAGLAALLRRADRAFALGADAGPIERLVPHSADEAFFASTEGFSLVHLCNHWTAGLLAAAGLPTTPVLDTLPAGLALDLKLRAHV
jgi:uncharacterized protein (TIGR02117 family)